MRLSKGAATIGAIARFAEAVLNRSEGRRVATEDLREFYRTSYYGLHTRAKRKAE